MANFVRSLSFTGIIWSILSLFCIVFVLASCGVAGIIGLPATSIDVAKAAVIIFLIPFLLPIFLPGQLLKPQWNRTVYLLLGGVVLLPFCGFLIEHDVTNLTVLLLALGLGLIDSNVLRKIYWWSNEIFYKHRASGVTLRLAIFVLVGVFAVFAANLIIPPLWRAWENKVFYFLGGVHLLGGFSLLADRLLGRQASSGWCDLESLIPARFYGGFFSTIFVQIIEMMVLGYCALIFADWVQNSYGALYLTAWEYTFEFHFRYVIGLLLIGGGIFFPTLFSRREWFPGVFFLASVLMALLMPFGTDNFITPLIFFLSGLVLICGLIYRHDASAQLFRSQVIALGIVLDVLSVLITLLIFSRYDINFMLNLTHLLMVGALVILAAGNYDIVFRMFIVILAHTLYRTKISGQENFPARGAVLLVSNHVSFLDAILLTAISSRPIRFMVHEDFYQLPVLNLIFNWMQAIKVPGRSKAKRMLALFDEVRFHLRNDEVVCLYPEGGITQNGIMQAMHSGIEKMLPEGKSVKVIPVRLGMVWGSMMTFHKGKMKFVRPHELPIPAGVMVGSELPHNLSGYELRQVLSKMSAEAEMEFRKGEVPIHYQFMKLAKHRMFQHTFSDYEGADLSNFSVLLRSLLLSRKIRTLLPENYDSEYIGVMLPNCSSCTITFFAILYADKSPAVLNFSAGRQAIEMAAQSCGAKIILTSKLFVRKLQMEPLPGMVYLEDVAKEIPRSWKIGALLRTVLLPSWALIRQTSPLTFMDLNHDAFLLFSSGSTGKAKAVRLSHHNITSDFFSFWRIIGWTPKDRIIGNLPMFHSFGLMISFWCPAMSGTRVIYLANPLDGDAVGKIVEREHVTMMMATPTFLQMYMRKCTAEQLKTLRLTITGGEKLRQDIAEKFHKLTDLAVVEGYGCTELSPIVSVNLASSMFELGKKAGKYGSIGVAMPGIAVKIVDPDTLVELPEDTPGLMLVRGANVMKGYLNNEVGTSEVMIDGWYNTGDIAKMDVDGYITITGRLSRFSKISGEMVPHELVENKLQELLGDDERVIGVTSKSDEKRGERLIVFYSTPSANVRELISGLREANLPNLWIPKAEDFIKVDKIPLMGNGKLDLQKLKQMAQAL